MKSINLARLVFVMAASLVVAGCDNQLTDTEYVEKAQEYLDSEDFTTAGIELKNALQRNQNNAQARYLLGTVYMQTGNPAGAEKELSRALDLGVSPDSVLPTLARALLAQKRFDALDGLPVAQLATGAEKGEVLASQGLGNLARGKLDKAGEQIGLAVEMAPDSGFAGVANVRFKIANGQLEPARAVVEKVVSKDGSYAPAWAASGDLYRLQGEYLKAEADYTKAIAHRQTNTLDYLNRAQVRVKSNKYGEAAEDLAVLVKRIPKDARVNFLLGVLKVHENELEDAKRAFELSLKADGRQHEPKFYLSWINLRLGNLEQAELYGEQALDAVPGSISVRKILAAVKLRKKLYAEAEELVRPIVRQGNGDVHAIDMLATALLGQRKVEEAIPFLEQLVVLDGESALAELRLGTVLLETGRTSEGMERLHAALEKDPGLEQARLLMARYYLASDQFPKALEVAETYRKLSPESPIPLNLLASLYLRQEREQEATDLFSQAARLSPGDMVSNHALASLHIGKQAFGKARANYESVLQKHPDDLETLLKLALLDFRENNIEAVRGHLDRAAQAHPDDVRPRVMLARLHLLDSAPDKVAPLFVQLPESSKSDPKVLEVLAEAAVANGDYREAGHLLEKLLTVYPKSVRLNFLMAKVSAGLNDTKGMKESLQRVLDLNPDHFQARVSMVRLALLEKDQTRASAELEKLEKLAPDHPDVLLLKGRLANALGKAEDSLVLLDQVFAKAPTTNSLLLMANESWALGYKDKAQTMLEKWVGENPGDKDASLALANTYTRQNLVDKAISGYQSLLREDQDNVVALNNLAWNLRERDPGKALEYARRARELAPESAQVLDTLALVQLGNNMLEESKRSVERALQIDPASLTIQYHSAVIADAVGESAKAERILVSVLQGDTSFPERRDAEEMLKRLNSK